MALLRESDLLEFIEHLPVAAYRTTPSGSLVMVNSALVEMLGFDSADDLLSVTVSDLYADPDLRGSLVIRLEEGEDIPPHEVELRRRDGTTIWVRVTARTVEDQFGRARFMEGVLEDVTDRHRIEAALEAAEERFSSAFRHAPQGLAIMDPDLVMQQVNTALCKMLGVRESELLIGSAARFIHPDELPDALGLMAEMRSGVLDSYKVERRLRHAEGNYLHTLIASSAIRRHDGSLLAIASQVFDVTDRTRVAEELAESEALFRGTFAEAPTGMVIADDRLRISRANPAICRLLGTTESVLQGLTLQDIWDLEHDDLAMLEALGRVESTHLLGERRLSLVPDPMRWALISASAVTGPGDKPRSILAQFVDVTERHNAIVALHQTESENSALLDAIPDMMLRVDRGGTIRSFRPAKTPRGVGPVSEAVHGTVTDLFPDHAAPLLEQVRTVLDLGKPAHFDFGLTGSPPERFFSATISRIDDTHALITVREVTEQKLVQHQLESLLKSKDDLVASVSHELRTPLTAIVGLATELRFNQAAFGPEEQQEFIRLIADQSSEMADLIDDLLVAARAERGQVVVEPRTIDLSVEVSQVLDVWTGGTAHVDLSTAPNAHADPFRVRQILRNLLSNAARYGTAPVHISVEQTADHQVELLVQDHGAGLSADQWDSIFDPYHRAPDGEKLPGSVGLGLTVSRHLAEVMRGSLDYYVEDGHSTFRLRLPTSPAA